MATLIDQFFGLRENRTDLRTEVVAGATTFVTLAYILFVNPNILKDAGMPLEATFAATCVASAFSTLVMGLYANYPIAVAPGMGLNAYFTYAVVVGMRLPWQTALGAVFISGAVFFVLTVTRAREWIVEGVPRVLRSAIGVGIGFFIAFIGLRNAGMIVRSEATLVTLSPMSAPGVLVASAGLVVTSLLVARQVRGALLIGVILIVGALTFFPALSLGPILEHLLMGAGKTF